MPEAPLQTLIAQARQEVEQGRFDAAERSYRALHAREPLANEPRKFLAAMALNRRQFAAAISMLSPCVQGGNDAEAFYLLGQAQAALGNFTSALAALERSVQIDPANAVTWLTLGQLQQGAGNDHAALVAYYRAVNTAQRQGRWRNAATTPEALLPAVKAAMQYVDDGRGRLFAKVFEPLQAKFGPDALDRVRKMLAVYLGFVPADYGNPWQKPGFLFFPDLPTPAFHPRELFPWMDALEAGTDAIREEMQAVLAADSGFEPFRRYANEKEEAAYLKGHRGKPAWEAYFFFRHGERFAENHARCPRTSAILAGLPLVDIEGHAPEILFSVLTPGSHILPHRGVTNTRLVTHLPLVVPPDCAIRVGDETRAWEEGKAFAFDDTFEHEAWNRSDRTRVVLLVDAWNPYLTEVERIAVHDLVLAIGVLHRECGIT